VCAQLQGKVAYVSGGTLNWNKTMRSYGRVFCQQTPVFTKCNTLTYVVQLHTWFSSIACVDTNVQRNLPVRGKRSNILGRIMLLNLNICLQITTNFLYFIFTKKREYIIIFIVAVVMISFDRLNILFIISAKVICIFISVYLTISKVFLHNKRSYNRPNKSTLQSSTWLTGTVDRHVKRQRGRWWNSLKQDLIRTCTECICTRNK